MSAMRPYEPGVRSPSPRKVCEAALPCTVVVLYRNGELAAVVFILNIQVKNLETIINALIWRNDDIMSWWAGYGWCGGAGTWT